MTQITIDYAEIWNIFFVFFSINTTLIGKSIQRVHIVVDADSIRSFKFNIKTLTNTVHFITIMGKGNLHGEDTKMMWSNRHKEKFYSDSLSFVEQSSLLSTVNCVFLNCANIIDIYIQWYITINCEPYLTVLGFTKNITEIKENAEYFTREYWY